MSDTTVTRLAPLGMITLRGDHAEVGAALEAITGCSVPDQRLSVSVGETSCLWMSPDEVLILCPYDAADGLAGRLTAALGDKFATVAVVSDARQAFDIDGDGATDTLAKLAPVNFAAMAPSEVRRTRMAQIPAALWRQGDGWRVVCFRSVAEYAEQLLRNAAA